MNRFIGSYMFIMQVNEIEIASDIVCCTNGYLQFKRLLNHFDSGCVLNSTEFAVRKIYTDNRCCRIEA